MVNVTSCMFVALSKASYDHYISQKSKTVLSAWSACACVGVGVGVKFTENIKYSEN